MERTVLNLVITILNPETGLSLQKNPNNAADYDCSS
jgi:hypothetical protein